MTVIRSPRATTCLDLDLDLMAQIAEEAGVTIAKSRVEAATHVRAAIGQVPLLTCPGRRCHEQ